VSASSRLGQLCAVALDRIAELDGDETKEASLRALVRAMNEIETPSEAIANAFERALGVACSLSQKWFRVRAFSDACDAIVVSQLERERRGALLGHALKLAACDDPAERVERTVAALEAMRSLRWGEHVEEAIEELVRVARTVPDEPDRTRATTLVTHILTLFGDCDRALEVLSTLPPSGPRARHFATIAHALARLDRDEEATSALEQALVEIRDVPESYDRSHALRAVLGLLVETGLELPTNDAVARALGLVNLMRDGRFKKEALLGAIRALPQTALDGDAFTEFLDALDESFERVLEGDLRAELLGQLAIALAEIGDVAGCERALGRVVQLAWSAKAKDLVDPVGDLPSAIPVPEILSKMTDAGVPPDGLARFAEHALELLGSVREGESVTALLSRMARFFASPALPYEQRVHLLRKALGVAQTIDETDARIRAVVTIANACSFAGATERGDALFDGLVSGVGAREARAARAERAVALVRLGRTTDAQNELALAATTTGSDSWHGIEELARAGARSGFLADMLGALAHVHPSRQSKARAQLADCLVESTYIDPHLREIGLNSLLDGADEPARWTISCLLAQLRLLEGLGSPVDIVRAAFEQSQAIADPASRAIFRQQVVFALIERIRNVAH
jgi:hypothetical protein